MAMEVEANPAALQRPGALRCDEGLRRRGVMWVSPPLHRATSEPAKFRDDALPMAGAATGRSQRWQRQHCNPTNLFAFREYKCRDLVVAALSGIVAAGVAAMRAAPQGGRVMVDGDCAAWGSE